MNLAEELQEMDLDDVIDRMNAYAISKLRQVGIKDFNGKEPIDFVGEVILDVLDGTRNWETANCTFEDFLFGSLRSKIDSFFKKKKFHSDVELPDLNSTIMIYDYEGKREELAGLLSDNGADDEELCVFECWMDGMKKPSEIASDLGMDVKAIYRITKRLLRSIEKIQIQAKSII